MPDSIEGLPAQVNRVEEKLDALAASVDRHKLDLVVTGLARPRRARAKKP
jgi:hypothetical protein